MELFLHDLRYSLRILLKNRLLTAAAVLSMALGIGANAAVFSAVSAALLKSLPYSDVERLVLVWGKNTAPDNRNDRNQVSATDIMDLRAQNTVFEEIATFTGWVPLLSGQGETERIPAIQVGDGYFKVMKGEAMLGRTFLPEEQQEGKDFVIVLGYGLWKHKFGMDPNVVGKTVLLNSRPYTVVGVMPESFHPLPSGLVNPEGQFYRPVAEAYDNTQRDSRHLRAIARLKPGVTLEQARAEMAFLADRLQKAYPNTNTDSSVNVVPLTDDTVGKLRQSLWVLFIAVTFVLLVACANVSNLLLVQSASRQREITVRAALGASRGRLIRQMLTQSLLLSTTGGVLGLLLAYWSLGLISALGGQVHPLLASLTMDWRVLGFTSLLSIASGLAFGLAPAWQVSRTELAANLRTSGQNTGASTPATTRLRGLLVAAEIAITVVLLVCAALFLQTVMRLREVNPGFNPRNVLTMSIGLPMARYPQEKDWIAFYDRALERLQATPGVSSAAMVSVLPLSDNFDGRGLIVEDHPKPAGQEISVDLYVTTPDYLRAMEIPVLSGRGIEAQDSADAFLVALINETMARRLWNGVNPIGKRIRFSTNEPDPWRTIVGVVSDVSQYSLDRKAPMQIYVPYPQFPMLSNSLVLKTLSDPSSVAGAVRGQIRALDSVQAVYEIRTMDELMSGSIALRRVLMDLLISLALVALIMASVGIYGMMSYNVSQKTREIGIRMALGADRAAMFKLIVRQGMALTSAGILGGVAAAVAATRLITGLLFETKPLDPASFLLVCSILCCAALAACLLPARRAAAMDPAAAIHQE